MNREADPLTFILSPACGGEGRVRGQVHGPNACARQMETLHEP
jgi:hypothetical protein